MLLTTQRILNSTSWLPDLSKTIFKMSSRLSSDLSKFRSQLKDAKHVVILTGAGVSAESGVPTFRGAGGLWRRFSAPDIATPSAFNSNPSMVWEFYHYRREVMLSKHPNPAHYAIADFEKRLKEAGKECVVITQNVDELHKRAGSKNVIELHGSLFKVRCVKCGKETENYDSPICEALSGLGDPDPGCHDAQIPISQLPHCNDKTCNDKGLLRPAVVWFGEGLNPDTLYLVDDHINKCDVCLIVGTSSIVYPASSFAPMAAAKGAIVAEFNLEHTQATQKFHFHFHGPCGETLPTALAEFNE